MVYASKYIEGRVEDGYTIGISGKELKIELNSNNSKGCFAREALRFIKKDRA